MRAQARKQVKETLEKYKFYLITIPEDWQPKVTTSYSLVPPSNTNQFHSSTEDIVVKRVDFERERDTYIQGIISAVNRLSQKEREIIIKSYFDKEEQSDYLIYNDLGYSESSYYKQKRKALDKLAIILGYISPDLFFKGGESDE